MALMPSSLCDGWSLSPIIALSQQVMWRVFIVADHGFVPTGFMCRPWRHTRLYAIQVIWRVFIVPDHGFMLTGFICLPWRHTRLYAIQEIWRVFIVPDHGFMPIGFTCRFWRHMRHCVIHDVRRIFIVLDHSGGLFKGINIVFKENGYRDGHMRIVKRFL
jgi:hypothetical protein